MCFSWETCEVLLLGRGALSDTLRMGCVGSVLSCSLALCCPLAVGAGSSPALCGTECGAASMSYPHWHWCQQQQSLTWFMQTSTFPYWQDLVRGPAYITTISRMFYVVGVASYNIDSAEHCGGKCSELISLKVCAMPFCSDFPKTWQNQKRTKK